MSEFGFVLYEELDEGKKLPLPPALHRTRVGQSMKGIVQQQFLEELAICGIVELAANACGVSPGTVWAWKRTDLEFSNEWDDTVRSGMRAKLENAAMQRALSGKSDIMLMFMLKAMDRARYDDKFHQVPAQPTISIQLVDTDGSELANTAKQLSPTIDVVPTLPPKEPV